MLTVNWNAGVVKPAPRKNRPNQRETWYPVHCPDCGASYELRKPDIERRGTCKYCGLRTGLLKRRHWSEEMVQGWLEEDAPQFEVERVFVTDQQVFVVDFVVAGLAIEVNGWGHRLTERQQRDQKLAECWPGQVLFLSTTDLRERPQWAREQLREVLQ